MEKSVIVSWNLSIYLTPGARETSAMKRDEPAPRLPSGAAPGSTLEGGPALSRVVGVDAGTETIKVVELVRTEHGWEWSRRTGGSMAKSPDARCWSSCGAGTGTA
jgi:hypothetical protein